MVNQNSSHERNSSGSSQPPSQAQQQQRPDIAKMGNEQLGKVITSLTSKVKNLELSLTNVSSFLLPPSVLLTSRSPPSLLRSLTLPRISHFFLFYRGRSPTNKSTEPRRPWASGRFSFELSFEKLSLGTFLWSRTGTCTSFSFHLCYPLSSTQMS